MRSARELVLTLLALRDVQLRVGWLREQVALADPPRTARALNELCERSERAEPMAREAMLALAIVIVQTDDELLDELRLAAAQDALLALGRLLRRSTAPAINDGRPPEVAPVPDYGTGRELTVGERRSLARRPDRAAFDKLLHDPHPLVLRQLFQNPRLTEDDVVALAARRPPREVALRELAAAPRWLLRGRVRLALVLNPGTPSRLAVPLLSLCKRPELREIVRSPSVDLVVRQTALEYLERLPPLDGEDNSASVH